MNPNYFKAFWMIVFLLGIAKCIKIAQRETTSRLCVYALMMALIGLLVASTIGMVSFSEPMEEALRIIFGILCLIAFIVSVSLGIIGLVQYKEHPDYRQGRKQAVSAIFLSVLVIGSAGFGVYSGIKHRLVEAPLPVAKSGPVNMAEFDELNFQYKSPGKPYVVLDAKTINKDATFAMLRKSPQIYFTIIAEKIGFRGEDHTEDLVKIARANMQSAAAQCSFSEQNPYEVNGLKGIRFRAEAQVNGLTLSYVFWVIQKNGYSYQLIIFGKDRNKQKIWQESSKLFANFRQIEPDRVYYAKGSKPFGAFTSELFGYSLDLGQTPWLHWEKATEKYPAAEVGAYMGDDAAAIVVPVFYADHKPSLDALCEALLKSAGLKYPLNAIKDRQAIHEAGMPGYGIQYRFDSDATTYEIHCKILSGEHFGYFAAAWVAENAPQKEKLVEQFFGPLHFAPRGLNAFTENKLSEQQKKAQARVINQIGLYYYRGKLYDSSLSYFKMATRMQPEKPVYLSNCLLSFNFLGQNAEALAFLDRHKGHQHEDPTILSWKAWHLKQTAQIDPALSIYARLFAGDYKNDEDFGIYARLLAEKKQWDKLEKAFNAYVHKNDSVQLRLDYAKILQDQGNHSGAIRTLEALQKTVPFDAKIAFALIRNYNAVGQPRKSLEISQTLIAKGFASADAYYYEGDAEYRLKWYRKAKQSLEKALTLAPQDKEIKSYINQVSAVLGQGDNTAIKSPIKQVRLPEILMKKLPALEAKPQDNGFDSYYLNIINAFSFKAGKEFKHTTYKRIKIVDAGGVSRFSTLQMEFNPLSEEIYVNELIVRDENGRVVSRGDPEDFYTIDSQKDSIVTYDRTLCAPVPNLLPGYTIEITSTIRKIKAPKAFPFERTIIGASRPVLLGAVFYAGDRNALSYRQTHASAPIQTPSGLAWVMDSPPVYRWEPRMVDYETFMAIVMLGSPKQSWEQIGADYLAKIRDKLVLDAPTSTLAKGLVKHDRTTQDKIMTLAKYVQTRFAYKAIEFGSRGLIPNSADLTIKNKYGDCKDHALLLHQLLKAVSIPSHLAFVNTASAIEQSLPSLNQFDHMILFVPTGQGGRFFDLTDKDLDLQLPAPMGLANRAALVLDPEDIHFVHIPAYADNNQLNSKRDIEVTQNGDLKVTESIELRGYAASYLRNTLKSVEKAKLQGWLQGLISDFESSAKLVSFNLANLYDNSQALVLGLRYDIKGRSRAAGDRLNFRSPGVWEHYYLDVQPREDRMTAFRISYPFSFQSNVSIKAPSGFAFGDLTQGSDRGQGPFGKWHARVDVAQKEIKLAFACSLIPGVFGPEKYAEYHDMMVRAVSSINRDLQCRAGSPPAPVN